MPGLKTRSPSKPTKPNSGGSPGCWSRRLCHQPKGRVPLWGRHNQAGGKSDPGDAAVLANILRNNRREHRVMPEISEAALAVRALARQHQEAIWARQLTVNRLVRSTWSFTRMP